MRKKLTLMFVALLSIAAFAATQALSRRAVEELTVVSEATTWDFSTGVTLSSTHEGDLRYEGNAKKDENIYANISELSFEETFKADALAFTGEYPFRSNSKKFAQNGTLHFKTSVAGKIVVTFSDTGSSASATAVKRYLVVNGTQTEYWASRENNGTEPYAAQLNVTTKEIAVPAGDVTITGSSAITVSYIAFTPDAPEDITISPASGDISTALAEASEGKIPQNITINLTEGGAYTVSESIVASRGIVINGNGATIDASSLTKPFIAMNSTPTIKSVESGQYVITDPILIDGVTIKGMTKTLFADNGKSYAYENFTINNSVFEFSTQSNIVLNMASSMAINFNITNSTFYSKSAGTANFIALSGKRPWQITGYEKETGKLTVANCTFYNLAKAKQFLNTNTLKGQRYLYEFNSNIFVDSSNKKIYGNMTNNTKQLSTDGNNTYMYEGGFFNETSYNGDEGLTTNPGFQDAANGDFTLDKTSDQYANATGDPRWIIYDIQSALTVGSNGSATVSPTEAAAGTTVTVKSTSAKAKYVPIVTATDKDGNQITVTASKAYNASDKTAEFTIVVPVGGIKTIDVQFDEQPLASSAAIDLTVPANLGAMDGTNGPTDLYAFLDSYLQNSPNPAYIKLTLQPGAQYIISKPIEIMSAIQIIGDESVPATIDATNLGTKPFVKIKSEDEATPALPNAKGLYTTIYNVEFKNFNVENLAGQFFFSDGQTYLIPYFTVDNCIIGIKGASGKAIFHLNGGYMENFTLTNSTLWSDKDTSWSPGGFITTALSKTASEAGVTKQTFTINNNTFYNISNGKNTSNLRENTKNYMWFEVKNNIVVSSGRKGQFVVGLNNLQNRVGPNWIVQNNSFQWSTDHGKTFEDTGATEISNSSNIPIAANVEGLVVFANGAEGIAEGDFSLGACPQKEAKIGDPRWLSASLLSKLITPESLDDDNDLAKAINQGVQEGFTKFQLAENARYSVKQTIVADKAIAITGKNVIIDVEHNDPFILLSKTPAGGFMPKASTEAAAPALNRAAGVEYTDYYKFDELTLSGLKVNGLKNSIIYDNNVKYCVIDLTIDNCVMQLETETVKNDALIAFQAGGVNNLTIKNSTFYGNNEVAKYFVRYNNSARIDRFGFDKADNTWSFTYENNTFYGLLNSDGQWGNYNGIVGKSAQGIVTVKNNIWYNCDAQTMRRLLHSKKFAQFSKASLMENNTFIVGGEAVDQGDYGNGSDLTGDPGFKRPAEGDFTLSAYSVQFDKKTGDPRWYADGGHYNPVTGIEGVEAAKTAHDGDWYTLQGTRVSKPAKGLYIHNGRKVVIK